MKAGNNLSRGPIARPERGDVAQREAASTDLARARRMSAADDRYNRSDKGRARWRRYDRPERGRERKRRVEATGGCPSQLSKNARAVFGVALDKEVTQMAIKVELVRADKADQVLEKALKIRNPELWQTRRKNTRARRKRRRAGAASRSTFFPWQCMMELLGLTELNRPFSRGRCELYQEEMEAGRWHFTPDPVVITAGGLCRQRPAPVGCG